VVSAHDRELLRTLATEYKALCESDRNKQKISMWRDLNSMRPVRPLVNCNMGLLWGEIRAVLPERRVEADEMRGIEAWFNRMMWEATVGDDRVFYPWYTVRAVMFQHPEGPWGVARDRVRDESSRGWRNMPVIKTMEDLSKFKTTEHRVLDPDPTAARMVREIIGDIIPVHVNRSTIYPIWGGRDLSEAPGAFFGLEELMYALYEAPEMVHAFMRFTRDAVVANLKQGEEAGDWSTADNQVYGAAPHCDDLPDPAANSYGARLKDLQCFMHAQEFEAVSPAQHEEFLLEYQHSVMELFGRVNYGCCDTLDTKLKLMKKIPNLSKVLSGPRSDPGLYPEAIGDRCIISWRPVATLVTMPSFNEDAQRAQIREGLEKMRGCSVEVHLHEPMTVSNDVSRIATWARIATEEAERIANGAAV
jgi:hypothetical protein